MYTVIAVLDRDVHDTTECATSEEAHALIASYVADGGKRTDFSEAGTVQIDRVLRFIVVGTLFNTDGIHVFDSDGTPYFERFIPTFNLPNTNTNT